MQLRGTGEEDDRVAEETRIAGVVLRVAKSLGDTVDPTEVEAEVRHCFANWQDAPVRDFVPVLAERAVRERLQRVVRG